MNKNKNKTKQNKNFFNKKNTAKNKQTNKQNRCITTKIKNVYWAISAKMTTLSQFPTKHFVASQI